MNVCKVCKLEKEISNFTILKNNRISSRCKDCVNKYNREYYKNKEEYRTKRKERVEKYKKQDSEGFKNKSSKHSSKFYSSIRGRAKTLLKSAQRRSSNFKEQIDIDYDFIYERLMLGVCEVTGIYFDFEPSNKTIKNPFAPSIDRIDSSIGYTKENTRIVIWQYNLMKGEIDDPLLLDICRLIVERNKNV